jgi:protease-4
MGISLRMAVVAFVLFSMGCAGPTIKLFPDTGEPLREFTLEGRGRGRVLVISVRGVVSDAPKQGVIRSRPSLVEEVVSQLRLAEKKGKVRAVVLKIDSPGGSTTASDLLYHEISAFKARTGVKVVVAMMDLATSGAYYMSLPADHIMAHPTTVTGSIGVILMRPALSGLMEKVGVEVEVNKSGRNKDMGSPFRPATEEEEAILQNLTAELGKRFLSLVEKHRGLDKKAMSEISTGRIFLAQEALQLGLVDEIGYLRDAIARAKRLSGLPEDGRVVVYRRAKYPNDNLYNTAAMQHGPAAIGNFDSGLGATLDSLSPGFHYLWLPLPGRQ